MLDANSRKIILRIGELEEASGKTLEEMLVLLPMMNTHILNVMIAL